MSRPVSKRERNILRLMARGMELRTYWNTPEDKRTVVCDPERPDLAANVRDWELEHLAKSPRLVRCYCNRRGVLHYTTTPAGLRKVKELEEKP